MGGADGDKPLNSYCMLQMQMNEVQKLQKSKEPQKSSPAFTRKKSKSTLDGILKQSSTKEVLSGMQKRNMDPNVPDRSYGDYYCPICDSHMNSDAMWEAHIIGKRHLKNVTKGDADSKYEDINEESVIKHEIRNVKDAIVGLSYIHEIRRKEDGIPPLFTCFLCQATFATIAMVIEHVISIKHRLNYIKEKSLDDYQLLEATNLKKGQMEPLVEEMAFKMEEKFGRGTVKVKQEKMKPPFCPFVKKRAFDSDDDDIARKSKIQKHEENPCIWKKVDYQKRETIKDCREIIEEKRRHVYSPDDDFGMHKRKDHIKHPVYDGYSRKYNSSPSSRELSKKDMVYPRTPNRSPSEEIHKTSQELSKKNMFHPRNSDHSPPDENYASHSRYSRSDSPQSPRKDAYNSRNDRDRRHALIIPPDEHASNSKSYQMKEKEPLPPVSRGQDSDSNILKDFVQKVYALPLEIFLKIVLLKLDNIEIKGIDEFSLLSKVINKAQTVFCNKLPPDVEAVVRQKMFRNAENNLQRSSVSPSVINQVPGSSTESNFRPSGSDFSFIRDILNRVRGNDSSPSVYQNVAPQQPSQAVYQNVTPHQSSTMPYQSSSYGNNSSYQNGSMVSSNNNYSASSSMTSGIPGLTLTEEKREAPPPPSSSSSSSSSYNYQPYYPGPSSNYPPYRY